MTKRKTIWILALGALIGISGAVWYDAAMKNPPWDPPWKLMRQEAGIEEYQHQANGLKVLLLEDDSAPVVTFMVTYLVGSRNETEAFRGGAHLLEHMMFKGTPRFNKEKNTQAAYLLQKTGAMLNASTWQDGTNYYETLPEDKLDLAIEIEADRMRHARVRREDLESEMPVVQSEFDRMDNSPLIALDHAVWAAAFEHHAYHYPIIGDRGDLRRMTAENLKTFYDRYYWPNNAVIAVIGCFEKEALLKKLDEKFGGIPRSPEPPSPTVEAEPDQKEKRFVRIEREDATEAVMIAHKVPPALHQDTIALDLLSIILSRGKTSRLYQFLVHQNAAIDIDTGHSKSFDPGLFTTEIILTPGTRHEDIENGVLDMYRQIQKEGILPEELERAKNQLRARIAFSRDGSFSMASQLSRAIAAGDWRFFSTYLDRMEKITLTDLQRVANAYWIPEHMTIGHLVSKDREVLAAKQTPIVFKPWSEVRPPKPAPSSFETVPGSVPSPKSSRRKKSAHGELAKQVKTAKARSLRILTLSTAVKDVVTIAGSIEGVGYLHAPNPAIAHLASLMLEEGTLNRTKFEIADLLETQGASLHYKLDHDRLSFSARCLSRDVALVLEILAEELRLPLFDGDEFKKQVDQMKVHIRQLMSDTTAQSYSALSRKIYEPTHPYYEIPFEDHLKLLDTVTLEEVRKFHQAHYGVNGMLLIAVGDLSHRAFSAEVKKQFAGWKSVKPSVAVVNDFKPMDAPTITRIPIPEKVNVDAVLGHALPLVKTDKDYLAAYVANAILGGNFSARLSNRIRDEMGLTYATYSILHGLDAVTMGHWEIDIILNESQFGKGIDAVREELRLFADRGVTAEELRDKQETLAGIFKVTLSTTPGVARALLENEELGFPVSYLDELPSKIEALDLGTINDAIRRYFHPEKLHLAAAGPFGNDA
ncbi:MAG: M16 family metallopeptidase [Candidatus Omnitrophota bacterium]